MLVAVFARHRLGRISFGSRSPSGLRRAPGSVDLEHSRRPGEELDLQAVPGFEMKAPLDRLRPIRADRPTSDPADGRLGRRLRHLLDKVIEVPSSMVASACHSIQKKAHSWGGRCASVGTERGELWDTRHALLSGSADSCSALQILATLDDHTRRRNLNPRSPTNRNVDVAHAYTPIVRPTIKAVAVE